MAGRTITPPLCLPAINPPENARMPSPTKPQAAYILFHGLLEKVYGPEEQADISARLEVIDPPLTAEDCLAPGRSWPEVEIVFSSWGMPVVDEIFLERFPRLRIIFYGAGSIKPFATPALWRRGIRVTNAVAANSVPVCEFSLSQILFGLKQGWQQALHVRTHRRLPEPATSAGAYGSTVGLVSLGMIGRMVAERLRTFDLRVIAYDPFVDPAAAARQGVEMVSLDELFARSDVISCHAPLLQETEKMIGARHFRAMKPGATFLNTSRGAVIDEAGMIEALRERPDLMAVLDVTHPEPPATDSPLYSLGNVVLTPHIAGSIGLECRRMGRAMVEELDRYLAALPLRHEIDEARAARLA